MRPMWLPNNDDMFMIGCNTLRSVAPVQVISFIVVFVVIRCFKFQICAASTGEVVTSLAQSRVYVTPITIAHPLYPCVVGARASTGNVFVYTRGKKTEECDEGIMDDGSSRDAPSTTSATSNVDMLSDF
jgi:hypothetical protein